MVENNDKFLVLIIVYHLILIIAKIFFLILGEGLTFGLNGSFDSLEKKLSINFTKANAKICLSLHYNADKKLFVYLWKYNL